jgi:hypothetical protein
MKKELITEINRYRQLMSLPDKKILSEGAVGEFLAKIGMASIEKDIQAFMEVEAKKIAQDVIARGESTSYRAGAQGAGKISTESVESVFKQIEKKSTRPLTQSQKLSIEMEIREALAEEVRLTINKEAQGLLKNEPKLLKRISKKNVKLLRQAEEIANLQKQLKGKTPIATWENLKRHFGKHWKKYLATGLAIAIFAYFWPDEEEPPVDPCVPPDVYDPQTGKCIAKGGGDNDGERWKNCPTFPLVKWCQSELIRDVQKCIGVDADSKFGPRTEIKLIEKGYETTITQEVYDEIMRKCKGGGGDTETQNNNDDEGQYADEDSFK